jgi:predicted alpha/beta hydrolase family esterase
MAQKVLLLHGWGGSNHPHWQSWLAGELAKEYGCVSFLQLSDYDFPKLDVWKKELKEHLKDFGPDIVVCHSLANILWFHLCNEGGINAVKKLFLVAPPSLECSIDELQSFFPLKAPQNLCAQEVLLITSTNDPYLSEEEAKTLQNSLGVKMEVVQNGGHINAASSYGPWEWMLEKIKS